MNPSRRSAWITSHFHRKYAIVRMHGHYIFVTRISRYSSKLTNPRFTGLHAASLNGFAREFRIATLVHTFVTRNFDASNMELVRSCSRECLYLCSY